MTTAYGYGRASTDGQTLTIDAQREKVKAYCEFKGLNLVEFIEDPATSSRLPISEREGGRRLCNLVRDGKVQAIVVAKLDRAWRSSIECLTTVDEWDKHGTELHLLDIGISVNTPPGRLFLSIMAAVAEMERAMISERTSTALRHAQAHGKRVSSQPPYGWESDAGGPVSKKTGLPVKIRPCAKEKAILAEMVRIKGEGMTPAQIAAALNKAGTVQRNGKPWVRQSIAKILARSSAFAQDQYR